MNTKMYQMRIRYQTLGGHTHIRIFTGEVGHTCGKAGDLTLINEEFEAWKNGAIVVQFIISENPSEESEG